MYVNKIQSIRNIRNPHQLRTNAPIVDKNQIVDQVKIVIQQNCYYIPLKLVETGIIILSN